MKYARFVLASTLFVLFVSSVVLAQNQTSVPIMPDFSRWNNDVPESVYSATLDGEKVNLTGNPYQFMDMGNLKRHTISVVNNEAKKPWLAFYTEEVEEKRPDGQVVTKETHNYIFEYVNGEWVFVVDLSGSQNLQDETTSFLKRHYGLEF